MAKNFAVNQEYVVVGNGAAELIKSLMNKLEGNIGVVILHSKNILTESLKRK